MAEFLIRVVSRILLRAARLLPPERRHWAEALRAEATGVPQGWPRADWLAGGLLLVAKEARMLRRILYGGGIVAVGLVVSRTLWISLRAAPAADVEATTDRMRVLVGVGAMVVLPWIARRRGVFGPVGHSLAARLLRLGGLVGLCAAGIWLVTLDRRANINSVVGSGHFNWIQEAAGLTLICAGLAAPRLARRRWPRAEKELIGVAVMVIAFAAFFVAPFQTVAVGYVAAVLAGTSSRSPVSPAALAGGALAGLLTGAAIYGITTLNVGEKTGLLLLVLVAPALTAVLTFPASLVAAWRQPALDDPKRLRAARLRQGQFTGLAAGAAAGLLLMVTAGGVGMTMMILGPVGGLIGGALGGEWAANHPRRPRPGGFRAGLFTASS